MFILSEICDTISTSPERKVKIMKHFSVDRFEEDYAVLVDDDGNTADVSKSVLPEKTREGSVLKYEDGKYVLDPKEEDDRRKHIISLQNKLFKK